MESEMKGSVVERHAQTIMVGLVTIGIVFVSSSILNQNADIRVLQQQNHHLDRAVDEVRSMLRNNTFVTQREFSLTVKEINRRLDLHEQHIRADEKGWSQP